MAVEIKVPAVGESVTEGILARWYKKDGDVVKAEEPLFELETDKATTEVVSPAAGTLHIKVAEGETVTIGTVVGQVEEGAAAPRSPAARKAPSKEERPQPAAPVKAAPPVEGDNRAAPAPEKRSAQPAEVVLSPSARRLAADEGVAVQELTGTGRGGRVTKEDVQKHVESRKPAPAEPGPAATPKAQPPARETRQRMSPIRQRIAERLVAAQQNAAILTTFNEADLSAVLSLRSRYKETFQQKHGVGLGMMSFFVKAAVEAFRAYPIVNARIDGGDIVFHQYYHIGVAVSTEKGLIVPVLRDADRLSFAEIEKTIAGLAQKARDSQISVADLQGGTFTITNGGVFGSLLSTPILNPPQTGILGMHTIQKRPVAIDDQVVIRPMMYLALSYDHRLVDGRDAVRFLVRIKECIESPDRMLLEV